MRVLFQSMCMISGIAGFSIGFLGCDASDPILEILDSHSDIRFHIERRVGHDLTAPYSLEDRVIFTIHSTTEALTDRITSVQANAECHEVGGERSFSIEKVLKVGSFPLHALLSLEDLGNPEGVALETPEYQCIFVFVGHSHIGYSRTVQNVQVEIPKQVSGGVAIHHRDDDSKSPMNQVTLRNLDFKDYHVTVFHPAKKANLTLKCTDFQQVAAFDPKKNSQENLDSFFHLEADYESLSQRNVQACQVLYGQPKEAYWAWSRPFQVVYTEPRLEPNIPDQSRQNLDNFLQNNLGQFSTPKVQLPHSQAVDTLNKELPTFQVERYSARSSSQFYGLEDRVVVNPEGQEADPVQLVQVKGSCENPDQDNTLHISKDVTATNFPLHAVFSLDQIAELAKVDDNASQKCALDFVGVMESGSTTSPEHIQVEILKPLRGGIIIKKDSRDTQSFVTNQNTSGLSLTDLEMPSYEISVLYPLSQNQITLKCSSFEESASFVPDQNSKESLASLFDLQSHYNKLMEDPTQTCRITYGQSDSTHWAWSQAFDILFTKAFNERLSLEVMFKMDRFVDQNLDEPYSIEDRVMFVYQRNQTQPHEHVLSVQVNGTCHGQEFGNSFAVNQIMSTNVFALHSILSLDQMQFHPEALEVATREKPHQLAYMSYQDYQCALRIVGVTTTGMSTPPHQVTVNIPKRPRGGISIHHRQADQQHLFMEQEGLTEIHFEDYHLTVFYPIPQAKLTLKCSDFETFITFDAQRNSQRRLAGLFPLHNHYEILMEDPLQLCHITYGKQGEASWAWSQPFQILFERAFENMFSVRLDVIAHTKWTNAYWFQLASVFVANPFDKPLFIYFDSETAKGLNINVNFSNHLWRNWWSGKQNSSIRMYKPGQDAESYVATRDLHNTQVVFPGLQIDVNGRGSSDFLLLLPFTAEDYYAPDFNGWPFRNWWFYRNNRSLRVKSISLRNPSRRGFLNFYLTNERGRSFQPIFRAFENPSFTQICERSLCDTFAPLNEKVWSIHRSK